MTARLGVFAYTVRGWPLLPIAPWRKEPLTPNGVHDATLDPALIADWARRWPGCNWAVATGAPGPDVVDVEGTRKPGGSGYPAWNELQRAGLVDGWQALTATPSGGLHASYTGTDQPSANLSRSHHIEIKARGGYVLVPPSRFGCPQYTGAYRLLEEHPEAAGRVAWSEIRDHLAPPGPVAPAPVTQTRRELLGGRLTEIEVYNRDADWQQLLADAGWTPSRRGWRRPDKARGSISATIGPDSRLYVYSTSVEWSEVRPDGRPGGFSPFDFYCQTRHGGDRRSALRELRTVGAR